MTPSWQHLVTYSLATFRLSLLLSDDTGPFRVFAKLRSKLKKKAKHSPALKKSDVAEGISCKRCTSVWVALPVAAFAYFHDGLLAGRTFWYAVAGDCFLLAMGLSAAAIIVNRAWPAK